MGCSPPPASRSLPWHRLLTCSVDPFFVFFFRLLDQHKLFTCFYRIGELRNREDLVKLILEHCDFSRDGHPRVFLRKALTSSYKVRFGSIAAHGLITLELIFVDPIHSSGSGE